MALVETEYSFGASHSHKTVEMRATHAGYVLVSTQGLDPLPARLYRLTLSVMMIGLGLCLFLRPDLLTVPSGWSAILLQIVGTYMIAWGVFWSLQAMKCAPELCVDLRNRAIHLVHRTLSGREARRDIILFEEVCDLNLAERASSLDMRSATKATEQGRLDMTDRNGRATTIMTGASTELELIRARLRRDLGLY
ncbi:MAG: hypothetical protein AAF700_07200 [Pseudomonadota bacterium]